VNLFKKALPICGCPAILRLSFSTLSTAAQARGTPDGFADLAERLSPAVVNISTAQTVELEDSGLKFEKGSPLERYNDFFGEKHKCKQL